MEGGIRRALSRKVDAILLDYSLPDGNGVRFLEYFAEHGLSNSIAVVMLTGTGDEMIAVQAMKNGAHDYLLKGKTSAESVRLAVRNAIYKAQTNQILANQRAELERLYQAAQENNRRKDEMVRELQVAKENAEAANRAKDRFLATLSHELRTPLTPVLSTVSSVLESDGVSEEVRATFEMIRRNIGLEARLIDDLLDLTRIARGKLVLELRPTSLHECVRAAAEICRSDYEAKGVELFLELSAEEETVLADTGRMHQILWNLLKNAVKFTPAGGRVTVRTRQQGSGALVIGVSDTGVGIPRERLAKIFDAFDQGNSDLARRLGGLGLGLAITRALVTAHGGAISAASAGEGHGTTFEIVLQLTASKPEASKPAKQASHECRTGPCRILLVEDHPDSAEALGRALRKRGFEVGFAGSVQAGVVAFEAERPDLVICDIGLPDGTGLDLMSRLRPLGSVRAIALSGFGMDQDVRRSREAGFSAHLTKPVDFSRLLVAVNSVLNGETVEVA